MGVLSEKDSTKEVWYPAIIYKANERAYKELIGTNNEWAISRPNSGESSGFNLRVPHDFTSLVDLILVVIPDATETIQWDAFLAAAAAGEDFETITNSVIDATLAVTLEVITELDISTLFTGVKALNYVGINFESDTSNIRLIGMRLRYT